MQERLDNVKLADKKNDNVKLIDKKNDNVIPTTN